MRIALLILFLSMFDEWGAAEEVGLPPIEEVRRLSLNPHYTKYLSHDGFPIVASHKVSDFAIKEASYIMGRMLEGREDILAALIRNRVRLSIMSIDEMTTDIPEHSDLKPKGYWDKRARGLGATEQRRAVSVGEENLLGYRGDPYHSESIMVHEFAHAIHEMGLNSIDRGFQQQLEQAFNRAALRGLWKGKYAGSNPSEYWAEAVQSWFDTNAENDHSHNHVDTREELLAHDPDAARLVSSVFGNNTWKYRLPEERKDSPHLKGYDFATAPTFSWPDRVTEAYEKEEQRKAVNRIALQDMDRFPKNVSRAGNSTAVSIRFWNMREEAISLWWAGSSEERTQYARIDPQMSIVQETFEGDLWIAVDSQGSDIGWIAAPGKDGMVVVR